MAGIGSDQRKQQQQNEQQGGGKSCLVQFRPIPDWKGEYGFDWFRMMGDYNDPCDEGQNADNFDSNIGKYMCASPSVKMYYNWEGKENGIEAEELIVEGAPVKSIVSVSGDYDVIVMGTLGRTGFAKLMMGSVAERVVRYAKCPVMVVRASASEEDSQ